MYSSSSSSSSSVYVFWLLLIILSSTTMASYFPPYFQISPPNSDPYPYFQTPPSSPSSTYGTPPPSSHDTNYGSPPPPPAAYTDDKQEFIKEHNAARGKVEGVTLPPLEWDFTLADYASNYAEQRKKDCALEHSGGQYGENIAEGSDGLPAKEAVDLWMREESDYDYETNECAAGKVCGHYTQVVWKNTTRLGCARITCDSGSVFVICSYDPPGNYEGEKPY